MQATIDLHESLQIGDRVHTTSGMQATVAGLTEDTVDLEIAPGVVTTWMKLAIRDKIEPESMRTTTKTSRDVDDDDRPRIRRSPRQPEPVRRLTAESSAHDTYPLRC